MSDEKTPADGNNGLLRVTGLWRKDRADGTTQLSGSIGGIRVLVLPNTKKDRDGQPDYILCLAAQDSHRPDPGKAGKL